jgi:hypothetical protein
MSPLLDLHVPVTHAVVVVPAQDPAPPPGQGEEFGKASPVALVVIILLALVTIALIRSMAKRIRRLPTSFERHPAPHEDGDSAEDARGGHA